MAITTYENYIPPSIEHLIWGGGYVTGPDYPLRAYSGDQCTVYSLTNTGITSYTTAIVLMSTHNYIVVCNQLNENYEGRYIGIGKCGIHPNPKIDIAVSNEAISVPRELTVDTVYLDYLPESWVNYILNIGYYSRYTYKLPIR